MLIDLLAIIFIIILSFIFCINDNNDNNNNNYKCQLSHIIIGMSVIVFYKLFKSILLNKKNKNIKDINSNTNFNNTKTNSNIIKVKEHFNNNSIQDFIADTTLMSSSFPSPDNLSKSSRDDIKEYINKISQLSEALNSASNRANDNSSQSSVMSPDTMTKLNLESQQQMQMFQINYLNKQLQQAKDNINAHTISKVATNYKPIKIYSSCGISNANGTTTVDAPITQQDTNTYNNTQTNLHSPIGQMLQTISQSKNPFSNTLDVDENIGVFKPLINKLFTNNTNISI